MKKDFQLKSAWKAAGDQPKAIQAICKGFNNQKPYQTLLGVTGSGKTFTMAQVIQQLQKPALVLAPNKTLAAQLFAEFRELFPSNAVEYFVSYYDYYQPEAYIPSTDTYIEKDTSINDQIDRMRHAATTSLLERSDVIIVSSVSCIYGLGSPEVYKNLRLDLNWGQQITKEQLLKSLTAIQYHRSDADFHRCTFRVCGSAVEIFPASEEDKIFRIELFDDHIQLIAKVDPLTGATLQELQTISIYPVSHYVSTEEQNKRAIKSIQEELNQHLSLLKTKKQDMEHDRLKKRTLYDIEMLGEMGSCPGIENYARHFNNQEAGDPPPTLLDYFPADYLMFIDESHISVPQIGAMYRGDRQRKQTLVEHGFRLPSALDNRPLNFQEFENLTPRTLYVSATPGDYEIKKSSGVVIEQIVRPTGLLDPEVFIRPAKHQVQDLLNEIKIRKNKNERVLVVTLTKKMAEHLTSHLQDQGYQARYLHSDIKTIERMELLKDLRTGIFQVLIGINLLREGLDLPEVSLVAVMDADKEGFLRSKRSLIQIMGRAARHQKGKAILYADTETKSIRAAAYETKQRRTLQHTFNKHHGLHPRSIKKAPPKGLMEIYGLESENILNMKAMRSPSQFKCSLTKLKKDMHKAAEKLDFEKAARIRDNIKKLQLAQLSKK